jgi:hypothetical protein
MEPGSGPRRATEPVLLVSIRLSRPEWTDRGYRRVKFRSRDRNADASLGRPMSARADRLDPLARMRMGKRAVGVEAERMKGVPEAPVDQFQERELRWGQHAASQACGVQNGHQAVDGEPFRQEA